jgi:uncharacterized membrane protein YeaQ/YmgE (transglycosylase-associated protein family)
VNFFSWIVFGLLAGGIAKYIMPGKDPGGCIGTVIIGMLGSLIGGLIGTYVLDFGKVDGFNLRSFGIAILGALILLGLYRLFIQRHPPRG